MKNGTRKKRLSTVVVRYSALILLVSNLLVALCMGALINFAMNTKQDAFLEQTLTNGTEPVSYTHLTLPTKLEV